MFKLGKIFPTGTLCLGNGMIVRGFVPGEVVAWIFWNVC
jgi:hypothetical protein